MRTMLNILISIFLCSIINEIIGKHMLLHMAFTEMCLTRKKVLKSCKIIKLIHNCPGFKGNANEFMKNLTKQEEITNEASI